MTLDCRLKNAVEGHFFFCSLSTVGGNQKKKDLTCVKSLSFWSEWRDTAAYGVLPACRPKCFAFRYPSTHQKAKNLPQATFFNAFCPLRVQVPSNFKPKEKRPHLREVSFLLVGVAGLEPAASSSRTKHATKLRYTPSSECTTAKLRYAAA